MTFTRREKGGHPNLDACGRGEGSGACGLQHRELKNVCNLRVKIEFFNEKTKKNHQKFLQMRY